MKKLLKSLGYTDLKSTIIILWWTIAMIALTAECNEILTLFNNFGRQHMLSAVMWKYQTMIQTKSNGLR